jgi:hypothetical protein
VGAKLNYCDASCSIPAGFTKKPAGALGAA